MITRAIRKCKTAGCFDEIWVNSEHTAFGEIAAAEGVKFHQRPEDLGNNQATSEQYIAEFFKKRECSHLFQVHSIAPLLTAREICEFTVAMIQGGQDVMLGYEPIQIECAFQGAPVNFTLKEKTNSQELVPVQRISWSITGWKRSMYLEAVARECCATYYGQMGYFPLNSFASHVIKTEADLKIAEALLPLIEE